MTSICQCGSPRARLISGPSSNFPGRTYYSCQDCNKFDWEKKPSAARILQQAAASKCKCGKVSVERTVTKDSPNKGRKFWTCANRSCRFFEWNSSGNQTWVPRSIEKKRPTLPGFVSYETDWKQKQLMQKLLDVGVDHKWLRKMSFQTFDGYEMVEAWKVHNPSRMEKYKAARDKESLKLRDQKEISYDISSEYETAMMELGNQTLQYKEAGEAYLLHGTDPSNLHSILFEGLDPRVANDGKFGRGVYFAENAAKMDQYTALDAHFEKDGPLSDLHQKIYQKTLHPQQVRYCLVARVVLGRPQRTNDGNKTIGQEGEIFSDATVRRATLEPFSDQVRPSSLIGEVGGINRKFREFIVFQPDQIFVEYVIAYRRVRKFCDCNVRVSERTVVKNTENRGRTMIKCGNNDSCNFFRLLPLCYCGSGACVKTSSSDKNPNREYYSCAGRRGRSCEFFQWKDNNYISDTNPSKKQRYD